MAVPPDCITPCALGIIYDKSITILSLSPSTPIVAEGSKESVHRPELKGSSSSGDDPSLVGAVATVVVKDVGADDGVRLRFI